MASVPAPSGPGPTGEVIELPGAATAWTILLNSKAGALKFTAGPDQLRKLADEIGLEAQVVPTDSAEHMRELLRQLVAEEAPQVAVAGGDGTIHLAVQELAHKKTTLGIIAQGTANNFATALRLPQDLPSALRVLQDSHVRKVDLGYACGEYFTEAAGVGLFADALAAYGKGHNKNLFRGVYALGHILLSLRPHRLKLTVDGQVLQQRAVMCTVANTYRLGSAMPVAPEAKVTDGAFDIVVVGDLTRREVLQYYRAVRNQLHPGLPKVTTVRGREVTIESSRPRNVHVDDRVVDVTPVTITLHAHALRVAVERL
jgi:YegS/Rv2252/BmrU family lipid kinase